MWFIFALTFSLTSSLSAIIAKRVMREAAELVYLFWSGVFSLPFLFLIIISFYQIPGIDQVFILAILGSIVLDVIAALAAYRAIKISEISLVAPISAFNPVFTSFISLLILGEVIEPKGWVGIGLVCIGAYLLQLSKSQKGIFNPIFALLSHKGVQLSLLAYFIWAITPIIQKTAILHTTPQVPPFVSFSGMIGTTMIYGAIGSRFSVNFGETIKKFFPIFLLVGLLGGVGQSAAFISFSLTNLGFATAIFKLSMIFTVVLGWLFFKEQSIKDRLLGTFVMLLGVFLLVT